MVPAYEGKNPYIFVSYAHRDSDIVLPVIESLYQRKYRVWYDEGIAAGSEWPKNIADHLNAASGVLVFVSDNSLKSPNCENEVVRAADSKKQLIQYELGASHPLLESAVKVTKEEELSDELLADYLGDGSGYDRDIIRKKFGTFWNIILILTGVLFIALAVALYGIKEGWFDKYLPSVVEKVERQFEKVSPEREPGVQIEDKDIEKILLEYTDKDEWGESLSFESKKEQDSFYKAIGWDGKNGLPSYQNINGITDESLTFEYMTDNLMQYLKYFPKLKEVIILDGEIDSFEELNRCPDLKNVRIDRDMFAVTLPEKTNFRVILQ